MSSIIFKRLCRYFYNKKSANKLIVRNNSNIIKSRVPNIDIPNVTIPELILENFNKHPNKIAMECAVTGKKYTFDDIRIKSNNLNKSLRKKLELKRGDVISLLLPNVPEYPICILGALEASLITTTINPLYTADEITRHLTDSNSKIIITLSSLYPLAKSAIKPINTTIPVLVIKMNESEVLPENSIDFREFIDTKCDIEDINSGNVNDVAFLPYSSGTTGLPKGVELSHRNIVANLCQVSHPHFKQAEETTETHQDVLPIVLPLFHIYGLTVTMLNHLRLLCKMVTLPSFTPETYVATLAKYRPHLLYIAPPILRFMSNHPSIKNEYLENMRTITSSAAPLGILDQQTFLTKTKNRINVIEGYGLTETSPTIFLTSTRRTELDVNKTVGELVANTTVKVVPTDNPLGNPLGPNQPGELLVKGPQVTRGYRNKPEETKNSFVDGWFRTGDVVHYDYNEMFHVSDRLKELIKVKGFQVAPAELEEVLRQHPDVADAAVIGVPHDKDGEAPRAYVVLKPNTKPNTDKLKDYVSEKVASFKRLTGGIALAEAIPRNSSGKILRRQLREEYRRQNK